MLPAPFDYFFQLLSTLFLPQKPLPRLWISGNLQGCQINLCYIQFFFQSFLKHSRHIDMCLFGFVVKPFRYADISSCCLFSSGGSFSSGGKPCNYHLHFYHITTPAALSLLESKHSPCCLIAYLSFSHNSK